jgi:hypothetical protein
MRRFVPGIDTRAGMEIPVSVATRQEPGSTDALVNHLLGQVGVATVITWESPSVSGKFRQLCYWRQVVNTANN